MTRNTRQEILDTAKQLFNERGYNEVSTRDIADSLNISKGNLTYHFKKKEDIVEALVANDPNLNPENQPQDLQELNAYFEDIQAVVQDNAFYFWHHAQLSQTSPAIGELQKSIFREKTKTLNQAIALLEKKEMIRPEEYTSEYTRITDVILLAGIYWMPFCKLKGDESAATYPQIAWSILYPLLTGKGKSQYRAL